jgi:hypothetical protein
MDAEIKSGPAEFTPSVAIVNAAAKTAEVTDDLGRKIVIRKISLFQRLRLIEALGASADIGQYLNHALAIASTVSINGTPISPVQTKEQLEALANTLDEDGYNAIVDGYNKHFKKAESGDAAAIKK